jgi:hypothetical protein
MGYDKGMLTSVVRGFFFFSSGSRCLLSSCDAQNHQIIGTYAARAPGWEYKKSARRDEVKDTDLGSIQLVLANDFDCDDEEWGEYDAVIPTSHQERLHLLATFWPVVRSTAL